MHRSPAPGQGAVRTLYDPTARELTIVADLWPTPVEEITVHAGPTQITFRWAIENGRAERSFTPPKAHQRFDEKRTATYHHGVLTITATVVGSSSTAVE